MSFLEQLHKRQVQKKANDFIHSLEGKSLKYIEQAYLDNRELANNEIVLSYLFFKHPELIRILPRKFQKSRLNSNVNMFRYGSNEAKRELVSDWLKANKFFMNANIIRFDDNEYRSYLRLYFNQPEDLTKLFMKDLEEVITILAESDIKETERVISVIKDKLTDAQWEYVVKVNPVFIKYAPQTVQNLYSEDERYVMYINGEARNTLMNKQIEKVKQDFSLLPTLPMETQKEYIEENPFIINYIDNKTLSEVLKYDIELIRFINKEALREDESQEVIYDILDNIENKSNKDIANILVSKCVLNAKGKLYRFDVNSNNIGYQYTRRIIKVIQKLSISQIISLIKIDVNYVLPYIVPVYNDNTERHDKENEIIDCNARCLTLFREYYGEEMYSKYYKVINKIYNEFIANIDKYDYFKDYKSIFELFKILFNKQIINNNDIQKITVFVGLSLLYKSSDESKPKPSCITLLNELLSNAYGYKINNNKEIYDIFSLEMFDSRLSFLSKELLEDFSNYNFVNMSSLLLIVKNDNIRNLFIKYYNILKDVYGENKELLFRSVENFYDYYDLLKDVENQELTNKEQSNFVDVIVSLNNTCNIKKKSDLNDYDITLLKKLIKDLSSTQNEEIYRNLICNYLYNKGYDERGNNSWLEVITIKQLLDLFDADVLEDLKINGNSVFNENEIEFFRMIKLLLGNNNRELLLDYIDKIISKRASRNIVPIVIALNKVKKYRVELINSQIISIDEVEELYLTNPVDVKKTNRKGVDIYTISNQDFKVLCSENDDGIHYEYVDASALTKNSYAYRKLVNNGSIRLTTINNSTVVKMNKDSITRKEMYPNFILVVGELTDELVNIAAENELKIVIYSEG